MRNSLNMSFIGTFLKKPSLGSFHSALFAERNTKVERGILYGKLPRYKLDVYKPRKISSKTPVVIFYYGGGWDSGDREMYGFAGSALASAGYIAVVPDYRLYPEVIYPDFMNDIALSYIWTFNNVVQRGNNRSPFFVMGHSAGAHMAALLTYNPKYLAAQKKGMPRPNGFIGLAGPYGYNPLTHERSRHIFQNVHMASDVQPVHQVRKGAAPALLIHGKKDRTVHLFNGLEMRDALRMVGSQAQLLEIENGEHVSMILSLANPYRKQMPVMDSLRQFISLHS